MISGSFEKYVFSFFKSISSKQEREIERERAIEKIGDNNGE